MPFDLKAVHSSNFEYYKKLYSIYEIVQEIIFNDLILKIKETKD